MRQILESVPGGCLRFIHDKLRESAYAALPLERCWHLHHRAAEELERRCLEAQDCHLRYTGLAHHWARAQVHSGPAITSVWRPTAPARPMPTGRPSPSTSRPWPRPTPTSHRGGEEPESWRRKLRHLHEGLGDLLSLTGHWEQARASLGEALARLPPDEGLASVRLHRKLGKTWETSHQHEKALGAYDEADAALGPAPAEGDRAPEALAWWQEWVELQVERNWVYYWLERVEEMSALVGRVRRVMETHGTPRQRTRFFMTLVLMLYRRDRYQVSTEMLEYGRQAVEASEACEEESEQAMPRFIHAFGLVLHGDLDEAEQESEIGPRLAERMGDMALQCRLLTYLTLVYRRRGQVDRTREYGEHTLRVATATRMDDYVGAAHASRAWVALREQRWEDAEPEARTALECWRKLSAVYPYPLQWQGLWVLVVTALRRRALAEAVEHVRALLDATQQRLPEALAAPLQAALDAWNQGQQEAACQSLEQAAECARQWQYL